MNKLSQFLVEQMLLEDKSPIKKVVVVYGGRFQPMHKGHYGTYQHLVKKFGKNNVFISTSNKVERPKSPFNFKEKVKIMTTMFNIPKSKIVQVKNNYAPTEILKKYDKNTTAFIAVVGEKDSNRFLGGKYFKPWKGHAEVGYEDGGYVYAAPSSGGGISGTETRNGLSVGSDDQKKSFFKSRAYGKFNATIFNMITDKLNEGVIEISKERIEEWLINESSKMSSGQVDDGPNFFFPNYDVFSKINVKRAAKIGYEVVNMITSKEIEDYYDHPIYPNGPVKAVTPFPAGVLGTTTATNQVDIYSSDAYSKWFKHVTRKAAMVGYELVKSLASKEDLKQDKEQSVDHAKGDKVSQKEYEASLNEAINLPVEVGDTILMGRFKNKKVKVKTIGKDEHGMPTINGKKVVTFRLMKEGFEVLFEDDSDKYTHVGYGIYKKKGKEDDEDAETFKKDGDSFRPIKKDDEEQSKDPKAVVKGKKMYSHSPDIENKPEQDNWEKVDDKNNYYKSVRKYTDKELEDETGEYFENETTQKTAPNAFKDKADMIEKMKNAKPVYLSSEEMENMNNTDMGDILNSDNPKQTAKERADEYGKDISWQYGSMEKNEKVPAPIALRDKNGEYHLVAGNTRAMAFTAAGKKLPIKVIDYDGEFQYNESISESNWPKSKLSTQHNKDFDHHLNYRLSKKFKGNFEVIGFDLYHDGKKLFTIDKRDTYNSVIRKTLRSLKESINEIAGTEVQCEKCNHSWEIESEDTEKYLCHSCGWDSQQQEYDYDAFDSWQEKMGLNEDIDERSKGKLRPADLLRRKAAMAGKKAQIARRRKRTMMRRKPLSKLKKIAYKKAYLQVYDEFRQELFPGIAKKDLSIQQAKIVHKNVLRKKKRVLKRARFRFLPALRDKEAEKFGGKNNTNELMIGYAGPEDMKRFAKRNKEYRKDSKSSKEYQYEPIKEQSDKKTQCINNFIEYACKRLKLDGNPKISLMSGTEYADTHKSLGGFNPQTKEIYVATENRLTADICRTIAHELVHRKQDEMGLLKDPIKDGADGSPIENQAHAVAGIIMREYGRINDTIYQEGINDFFYIDFKKYVYKNRKQINQKLKGLSYRKKSEFLELLWKKVIGKGFGKDADGRDIQYNLKQDKLIKEGLKELGITDFKSLFKKMPSDLQKRVYNLKNFGQRADKHPEGNVLKHTITVVNRSIKDDDIDIAIAAMLHDIGKDETAGIHPKKGHITHFGHEKVSATLVNKYRKWIESVGGNVDTVHYIVKNHMRYKQLSDMRPKKQSDLKSHPNFDKLSKFSKHDRGGLGEGMIMEGGAYGHMSHPFDTDINLTFGQLKDIVNRALEGTLEFTREKTDGQALAISWRDGRLVAARNKGHLKNKGENALDIKGVSDKFQGRGGLSDAYNYAMKDLSNAISSLNDKQRDKIFKQGACFMNLEVIYPTSVNVIPYGQALLVFHGTMEYDMDGKAIGENGEAARILAGMIKQVNKDVQDNYTIQGPPVVKLPKSTDLSKKRSKYSSQITKLQKEFNLKDTDGVANYHQSWWEQWVDKNSPSTLDNKTKMGLVKRWAFMDKKFRLDNKNITDSKTLEWAKKIDKEDQKKISKQNLMKFEKIFLGLGAEVLEFTSSALTVNPDAAVRDMKKRIDKTIKDVKKSGDPKKIEKLKLELGRLNSIGGSKKIVPNEGIVFLYKGNTFKLTGTFASVNQILGIFF
jgi:hypothetical protein